jgi:hypothetical protein
MRQETTTRNLYEFQELNDKAKDKARDWWRKSSTGEEWWEGVYDDAEGIGLKITSFDTGRSNHITGQFIEGATDCSDKILQNHGEECETHGTALAFIAEREQALEQEERDEYGDFVDEWGVDSKLDEIEGEFLKELLEEYLSTLKKEYEWLMSDERVEDAITCNEYEFTEEGKIA